MLGKSGLRVKADVKIRDMKKYGGVVEWRSFKKGETDDGGCKIWRRPSKLGPFVVSVCLAYMAYTQGC